MPSSPKKIIHAAVALAALATMVLCAANVIGINSMIASPDAAWKGGAKSPALAERSYAAAAAKAALVPDSAERFEWLLPTGDSISLETAGTPAEQELGLGGRASMPADQGMLFVFPAPGDYGFWMKDMEFPIDIIWLDDNFRIMHVEKGLSPDTYPKVFDPHARASYVIEVNAGIAEKYSLKEGDGLLVYQD